jgi:hypothetical protein
MEDDEFFSLHSQNPQWLDNIIKVILYLAGMGIIWGLVSWFNAIE